MFCPKCGAKNLDTSKFCKACGRPLPNQAQIQQALSQSFRIPQSLGFVGQTLDGKYRIDAKLGAGGMGDVYRATRLLIGDTVAIKFLHAHLAINPQAAERFRHEAVTATKLRHRNIVAIYDVGISAAHNLPYILMEIAEGLTLRQIINHSRVLPLDFAVTVIAQVCAALDEAHRLGIVHRDIKPENIIAHQTSTGWHVKVLDFGIAKFYNEVNNNLTQDGSALGTPQYMSPEQCMGEPLDGRSDIYSVGIVLYEMLCGTPPFKNFPPSAIAVHQVQTAPPPPCNANPNITEKVEAVILRALSKSREERQPTAQRLSQELIQAATIAFKSGALILPNQMSPTSVSTTQTNEVLEKNLLEKDSATETPIPKPNDSLSDEESINEQETLVEEKRDENSEEHLKKVFEDAEFILDEILIENKTVQAEKSQPIDKPSDPLIGA